jgi:hypothetical protein
VSLITPNLLINILKNIFVSLPEGLELVQSTEPSELAWYYEFVKATMVSSPHGFLLVLAFPLKDVNRLYVLHRVCTFPMRVMNGTFMLYKVERAYFAISSLQHTHFSLSETKLLECYGNHLKVCPAEHSVNSVKIRTCSLSMYLQLPDTRELCSRVLTTKEPRSTLERGQTVVIYYTVKPAQAFVRCPHTREWDTNSVLARRWSPPECSSVSRVYSRDTIIPTAEWTVQIPSDHAIIIRAGAASNNLSTRTTDLETIAETSGIDKLVATIQAHKMEADLNTVLHTHASQIPSRHQTEWYVLIPTSIGVCVILFVVLQFSQPHLIACLNICKLKRKQENGAPDVSQSHPAGVQPKPRQMTAQRGNEEASEEIEPQVRFNTYPLRTM